ncbi:hypothetical protein K466DRAFT_661191 [Polyporus arcularius HHB13444]|uniref:Uncharacterized protein n=1 Tax=Polyporus arcularius HHB13444 TaxID=1314778 RepID=A0A5C3PUT3_9APHY|nr:hypothetical protein K466DRAFT_661191 [Polyporus arcularius HHB13444]
MSVNSDSFSRANDEWRRGLSPSEIHGQAGRTQQTQRPRDGATPVPFQGEYQTHGPRPPGAVPIGLNEWVLGGVMVLLILCAVGLEVGFLRTRDKGRPAPSWWVTESFHWEYYLMSSLPLGGAMVLSLLWGMVQDAMLKLQPLVNLTCDHPARNAKRTVLCDYTGNGVVASYRAWRNSDYMVVFLIMTTLLTTSLKPLSGTLLSVRDVWWLAPAQNVTGISKVSQDAGDQFKDMIAFQGASGFATARVLFDIGPAPFITEDGHAVEAFQLPVGQNGTAYANVTAVFNRAVCVSPTTFLMENDGTMLWNNTVWFDDCRFSFTVDGDSPNLFGVETLPDLAECTNFIGTPPQHRPVVFWFFSYEPQPIVSAVQCTPQVSVSDVRVAIDLASNTTSLVATNETRTSTIGSVGYLPYNGLFFDNATLDTAAMSRLQSVQEQLPSAVFQAAKAKDPSLRNTFVYYGFTNITAEIYNTYLSLIARSLYFVPSEEPVLIEVGANCKRLFLVAIAVHSLAAVMFVLAFYGALMGVVHHRLRRRFTIPEHYGTLATGFLLTVDPEVGEELQQAAALSSKAGSIPRALAGCRFAMDVQTGRVGMTRVPALCVRRSRLRRVCSWLGRMWSWRAADAGETETAETASTAVSAYGRSGSRSTVATAV